MKICFACDLHLPYRRDAAAYQVLEWILDTVRREQPGAFLFAGDCTADGDEAAFRYFLERMGSLNIPFLWIPGNSDLRTPESAGTLRRLHAPCRTLLDGTELLVLCDADGTVEPEACSLLEAAGPDTVVMMHHPPQKLREGHRERMQAWLAAHPGTALFCGHEHAALDEGNLHILRAADPDKARGGLPCVTVYDTGTRQLSRRCWPCPMPQELPRYFGISCYHPAEDIPFAVREGLRCIELRPNFIRQDQRELARLVERWRDAGGENLSVHLPDVAWTEGAVSSPDYRETLEKAAALGADRFTQHVPKISVREASEQPEALARIGDFIAGGFRDLSPACTIGVENMHMTAREAPDASRRYGYLPGEALAFMELLRAGCGQRVGFNLDIGHARNNPPLSQRYTLSTWYAEVGRHAVGYHIHQVVKEDGVLKNHTGISGVYDGLISFGSLFASWRAGQLRPAPFIFEMRVPGAYRQTLDAFRRQLEREREP